MKKSHAGNRDYIMSNIKERSVKLAILCLILLDIFLVLYSCENRERFDPTDNSMPIVTTAKVSDSLETDDAVMTGSVSSRNDENMDLTSFKSDDSKVKVTAFLEK
jgi:hypothetical protein